MTLTTLLKGFKALEVLKFPNPPDMSIKLNQDIWKIALSDLSDKDFMKAIGTISKTCKFFPTPFQIIQAATSDNLLAAAEAWEMLQEDMNNCMGATGVNPGEMTPAIWRVIKIMGDLPSMWNDKRGPAFVRSEFIKFYKQFVSSGKMIKRGEVKELE